MNLNATCFPEHPHLPTKLENLRHNKGVHSRHHARSTYLGYRRLGRTPAKKYCNPRCRQSRHQKQKKSRLGAANNTAPSERDILRPNCTEAGIGIPELPRGSRRGTPNSVILPRRQSIDQMRSLTKQITKLARNIPAQTTQKSHYRSKYGFSLKTCTTCGWGCWRDVW